MSTFVYSKNGVTLTIETDDDDFDPNLTYAVDFFESIFEDEYNEDEYDEDEWEENEEE